MSFVSRISRALTLALTMTLALTSSCSAKPIKSWLCYYGSEFPADFKFKYDLYVLNGTNPPSLEKIKKAKQKAVGYVSFGEIRMDDEYYLEAKKAGLLIDENPNWPTAYRVDIKDPKWHKIVLEKLVPSVLEKGFDGIFIDTIDTSVYLENEKKMKGEVDGAKKLIHELRKRFPKITIVLNNGIDLLNDVGNDIDALVIEDVYTLYDFTKKEYKMAEPAWRITRLEPLKAFKEKFNKPVLALEYLDKNDKENIAKVKKSAKQDGLILYIADIGLTKIFFHP